MKGKVRYIKNTSVGDAMTLELKPESYRDKKWMRNAFQTIRVGTLTSKKGEITSLVLWTDRNK